MSAQVKTRSLQTAGMVTRLLVLALIMLVIGAIAIPVFLYFELLDLQMAMVAFGVCVISSLVAHIVGEYPRGDDYFMARLALSIAARTALPFLAVIIAKLSPSLPFEPGFVFLIVLFYLVGLIVDVTLHAIRLKPADNV